MPQDFTDDKSTLVQVMAWCRQATSHYLSQCWPRSPMPYGVTRPQWVNSAKHITPHESGLGFMTTIFPLFSWFWFSGLGHCRVCHPQMAIFIFICMFYLACKGLICLHVGDFSYNMSLKLKTVIAGTPVSFCKMCQHQTCPVLWGGWGCEVSCGGHHRPRGKTTTGSALDGAVFDIAQILAYLVHNMSRSQLYLGFGHFGWLPSFFGQ